MMDDQAGAEALDAESVEWERVREEGGTWGGRGRGGRAVARQFASLSARTRSVHLHNVHVAYASKTLLSGAELTLLPARRYALLGRNGVGKSTLLRQLRRGALPGFPQHLRVALVAQDEEDADEGARPRAADDERPALVRLLAVTAEAQLAALETERAALEAELDALATDGGAEAACAAAERLCEVEAAIDALGARERAGSGPGRGADNGACEARRLLAALGFAERDGDGAARGGRGAARRPCMDTTPTCALSGGWAMRLRLACALLSACDLLMMDEPTNHLDLEAALWLQQRLAAPPSGAPLGGACAERTVLFVSHDLAFVDAVATDIVELREQTLRHFRGGYAQWARAEAEEAAMLGAKLDARQRQEAAAHRAAEALSRAAQQSRGTDGGAALARQAKQKAAKAERIGLFRRDGKAFKLRSLKTLDESALRLPTRAEASQLRVEAEERFVFPDPPYHALRGLSDADDALVTLDGAAAHYAGQAAAAPLLRDLTLALRRGDKVALVGRNGAGKSTLLRLMHGELAPCDGVVRLRPGARVAYIPQRHADALAGARAQQSAAAYLGERFGVGEHEARSRLGRFGLSGPTALLPIGALSGGQRVRLSLAAHTWDAPHILLLDEPTNHLDAAALGALAAGLREYAGAVLLVSHDRHFCAQVCAQLWLVERGTVRRADDAADAPFEAALAGYEARLLGAARARAGDGGSARGDAAARAHGGAKRGGAAAPSARGRAAASE